MTQQMENMIKELLDQEYENACFNYTSNNIFGTFVVGKANYGFAREKKDIKFITVFIPTFEQLCTGEKNKDKTELGEFYDIRSLYSMSQKEKDSPLELLFSDYYIINPKYKRIFTEKFLNNREKIGHYCDKIRLEKAYFRAADAYDRKDYFEVIRLYQASYSYFVLRQPCYNCFHLTNETTIQYMWDALDNKLVHFNTEKLVKDIFKFKEEASDSIKFEAKDLVIGALVDIVKESFIGGININGFVDSLTKMEKQAYEYFEKIRNGEKEISLTITNLIADSGISRPVWKSVFDKLVKNNMATVKNEGVKGTLIKILY